VVPGHGPHCLCGDGWSMVKHWFLVKTDCWLISQ
jgi:hypothetical protein